MQIPGGWLLDKFGSKKFNLQPLFCRCSPSLQGFVDMFPLAWLDLHVLYAIYAGVLAPSFPANARIVAARFLTKERGTASAIFNSAQYFVGALSPLLGWLTFARAGEHVFTVMGGDWFCVDGAVDQS